MNLQTLLETLTSTRDHLLEAKREIATRLEAPVLDGTPFVIIRTTVAEQPSDREWMLGSWDTLEGVQVKNGWRRTITIPWHFCGAQCYGEESADRIVEKLSRIGWTVRKMHTREWLQLQRPQIDQAIALVEEHLTRTREMIAKAK